MDQLSNNYPLRKDPWTSYPQALAGTSIDIQPRREEYVYVHLGLSNDGAPRKSSTIHCHFPFTWLEIWVPCFTPPMIQTKTLTHLHLAWSVGEPIRSGPLVNWTCHIHHSTTLGLPSELTIVFYGCLNLFPPTPTFAQDQQNIQTTWYTCHQRMNKNTGFTQLFWLQVFQI